MNRFSNVQHSAFFKKGSVGAIAATLLTTALSVYGAGNALAQTSDQQNVGTANTTIDDIIDNPTDYTGRLVTVRSEADRIDDRYSFVLDDEDGFTLFGLDFDTDELLVFNASGAAIDLPEDNDAGVQVTGIVRPFVRAEVERQLGITLDPEIYAQYESQPALFAQAIAYAP